MAQSQPPQRGGGPCHIAEPMLFSGRYRFPAEGPSTFEYLVEVRWRDDAEEAIGGGINFDAILCTFTILPASFAGVVHAVEEGLLEYFNETFFQPLRAMLIPYVPFLRPKEEQVAAEPNS